MDLILKRKMWELIKDIRKTGTTIIVASHSLVELKTLCDRLIVLSKKRIVYTGPATDTMVSYLQ